jgi:hypothetical protein
MLRGEVRATPAAFLQPLDEIVRALDAKLKVTLCSPDWLAIAPLGEIPPVYDLTRQPTRPIGMLELDPPLMLVVAT